MTHEDYIRQVDSALRREKDPTKRQQLMLLLAQVKAVVAGNEEVKPHLQRQIELMTKPVDDSSTH